MGKQQSDKPQGRHAGKAGEQAGRRREPLRDNYYYEQPPRHSREPMEFEDISSSSQGGGEFQDISSYSSDRQRQQDQRELRQASRQAASQSHPARSRGEQAWSGAPQGRETPRKPRKSAGRRVLSLALAVLVVALVGLAGAFLFVLSGLRVSPLSGDLADGGSAYSDSRVKNIALFGVDARDDSNEGRSDVLAILTVDNRRGTLKLTSILRDSQVYIEGYGYDKATHAYAYGGPELAVRTVNQTFHLDITDYVTVNFGEMAQIVDAFGGVEIALTADEKREINRNLWNLSVETEGLIKGTDYLADANGQVVDLLGSTYSDSVELLNGNQAVAYGRIREIDSDDARVSRQQQVLQALVAQLKKKNIFQYPGLLREVATHCETSLGAGELLSLSPIVLRGLRLETLSIPGAEEAPSGSYTESGAWVYVYDTEQAAQHISRFIYEEDSPYWNGGV